MGRFSGMNVIRPNLKRTETTLTFTAVQPSDGDYLMVAFVCLVSIPLAWYTTKHLHYAIASVIFYWVLAYSLIDDTFITVIDKNGLVEVKKYKTGRIKWIRAAQADELINVRQVH